MSRRRSLLAWLQNVQGRSCAMWLGAVVFGEACGAALGIKPGVLATGLAVFVAAVAGALGAAALVDALATLLPAWFAAPNRTSGAATPTPPPLRVEPASAWNFDYRDAEPESEWISDAGRAQVAWAEATLAARDAWERAARNSRTRVVLGKRVILGDPPPRSGDDT